MKTSCYGAVLLVALSALAGCAQSAAVKPGPAAGASPLDSIRRTFGPPAMLVPKPATAPVIDGKLDEAAWRAAKPVTLGFTFGGWQMPSQKTEARVLADEKAVYVAVKCWEAHPEQMVSVRHSDLSLRNRGDQVELFLDPLHEQKFIRHYFSKIFHSYYHVIVSPKSVVFGRGGPTYGKWTDTHKIVAKSGRFKGGWTVECAIPMSDMRLTADTIPDVWGLNICRQRPELGAVPSRRGLLSHLIPVADPAKCRDGEYTAWAPTYDDYSYENSMPFHHPEYFGHAVLAAGVKKTARPKQVFEVLYKSEFDAGKLGPWGVWRPGGGGNERGVLIDESFRGKGKSVTPKGTGGVLLLQTPLKKLQHVNLIMTVRAPKGGRIGYFGRAPDRKQCGAQRHDVFMTKEAAAKRKAVKHGGDSAFPGPTMYHTHASMLAWKPIGRLWPAPGGWALMSGYFSEPTQGDVMWPGTDWVILRTRLGLFRRYHGGHMGQALVPRSQGYPGGLTFSSSSGKLLISDLVIFRGSDIEPPEQVTSVKLERDGAKATLTWNRAEDNTLAAYYRVYAGKNLVAETHRLSVMLDAKTVGAAPLTVVAYDLYGNASTPAAPAK